MAKSQPTHVALSTGGGQGIGKANRDPEVLYMIADTAFAAMRLHSRKLPSKSEIRVSQQV